MSNPVAIDDDNVQTRENGRVIERTSNGGFKIATYVIDVFGSYWRKPYTFPANVNCPRHDYNQFMRRHHVPNCGTGIVPKQPIKTWRLESELTPDLVIKSQKLIQDPQTIFECYSETQADLLFKRNKEGQNYFGASLALTQAYCEKTNGFHMAGCASSQFIERTTNHVFSRAHGHYMKVNNIPYFLSQKNGDNDRAVGLILSPQQEKAPYTQISAPCRHPEQLLNWQHMILQKQCPNHCFDEQEFRQNQFYLNRIFYANSRPKVAVA